MVPADLLLLVTTLAAVVPLIPPARLPIARCRLLTATILAHGWTVPGFLVCATGQFAAAGLKDRR